MGVSSMVYLDGVFLKAGEAKISPFDRGFLFADAVYEVTAVYNGKPVDLDGHMRRLERSLTELGFNALPDPAGLEEMHRDLILMNGVKEGLVYLQVTRGAYGARDFLAPEEIHPSIFAFVEARSLIDAPHAREGISVVTVEDVRWTRRDIKTTQLLAQTLAKTAAKKAGVKDAWMVEDGFVTEAASANAWIVTQDGVLVTRHLSNQILAGITRASVISRLGNLHFEERAFTPEEARAAKEAFSTSASALIAPVIEIDGVMIGDGKPGPVVRAIQRAYFEAMGADIAKAAPWAMDEGV